jgi:hypothetical protein
MIIIIRLNSDLFKCKLNSPEAKVTNNINQGSFNNNKNSNNNLLLCVLNSTAGGQLWSHQNTNKQTNK